MALHEVFISSFFKYDIIIFILAGVNVYLYNNVLKYTNKIYYHFNSVDYIKNLSDDSRNSLNLVTKKEPDILEANDLLNCRRMMNSLYSFYSNITTIFPLLGMLGTVISLIPMVGSATAETTGLFFSALTSTLWGIIAAIIFKFLDSFISYKIEDNEKHIEHLFNPTKDISGE